MAISNDIDTAREREVSSPSTTEQVSVVIPCYNEERFIGKALHNLADQYDHERYEIVIVDGMSADQTREAIAEFCRARPEIDVRLIDNPARSISTALNLGIDAARGDVIARLDAHAFASPGYIRRCVEVLRQNNAGVVGLPCRVVPGAETPTAKAIALAVSHPFGIGDAKYRLGKGESGQEAVDTVAFACFKKQLWREVGGFSEELLTNEDYDFNYRVRLAGRPVVLDCDHSEHSDYFARTTLKELFDQYSRYGSWKAKMIRRHPRSIKWRQMVAPVFAASLPILFAAGFWLRPAWWLLGLEVTAYLLLAFSVAVRLARKSDEGLSLVFVLPLVFCTIHLTWGSSFLLGLVRPPSAPTENSPETGALQ
jgi:glycosyltransferase involved in cell wall biosynthesis